MSVRQGLIWLPSGAQVTYRVTSPSIQTGTHGQHPEHSGKVGVAGDMMQPMNAGDFKKLFEQLHGHKAMVICH